jgi:hypothetical protein
MNDVKISITSFLTIPEIKSIITEKIEKDNPKFRIQKIEERYVGQYEEQEFEGFDITYDMRNK